MSQNAKSRCLGCLVGLFKVLARIRWLRQCIVRQVAFNPPIVTYTIRQASQEQPLIRYADSEMSSPFIQSRPLSRNSNIPCESMQVIGTPKTYQPKNMSSITVQQRIPIQPRYLHELSDSKYPEFNFKLITDSHQTCDVESIHNISIASYVLTTQMSEQIASIYIEVEDSEQVILFSHGNSADLGHMLDTLLDLAQSCHVNVFSYEYSGYGQSTGISSDLNVLHDIYSAYYFLVEQLEFQQHNIIVYGFSIGSGPSTLLASRQLVGGLILHSGLSSGLRVLDPAIKHTSYYDIFPNIDLIRDVICPVFILHGGADSMINVVHAEQLASNCQNLYSVWLVEQGGHCDIDNNGIWRDQYLMRLNCFLQYCSRTRIYPKYKQPTPATHLYDEYNFNIQQPPHSQIEC